MSAGRHMRTRRSKGCLLRILIVLGVSLAVLAVATAAGGWFIFYRPAITVESGKPVQIEVPEGESTAGIGAILAERGVVANANMFRLQSRLSDADGQLRAGVYDLSTGMPYDLVIEKLKAGPPIKYVTVTVPEGFITEQIAARMEKQAGINAEQFMDRTRSAKDFSATRPYLGSTYKNSLEGYLFPKTYRIEEGTTSDGVIEMMLAQFDRELAAVNVPAEGANGMSLNELVIIASMIERETRVDEERALVSSVIYNRLRKGMRLEIDATIEYVLPGNRFRLRYSDLKIDSPYNTYLHAGLPPGPIANPGAAALKAAAYPAKTEYIYYVLTGKDGSHTFATNETDFLRAKKKSKEVFGK